MFTYEIHELGKGNQYFIAIDELSKGKERFVALVLVIDAVTTDQFLSL
jgi:hypothetical protein